MQLFKLFVEKIQTKFEDMCDNSETLFRVSAVNSVDENGNDKTGEMLYNAYLSSFRTGDDPVFRNPTSTTHTCNNDKNFIKNFGNVVAIVDNKIVTMWDIELAKNDIYFAPCKAMSEMLHKGSVTGFFVMTFNWLNTKSNYEKVKKSNNSFKLGYTQKLQQYTVEEAAVYGNVIPDHIYQFDFFNVNLPKKFVNMSEKTIESIQGDLNTSRQLFQKGLNIPLETLELVRDQLIQDSFFRGDAHLPKVLNFIEMKKAYENLPITERYNWVWLVSTTYLYSRFANELIGTTCIELAEGKDLNKVVDDFKLRIDPANYKKAKALEASEKQKKDAEKVLLDLRYVTEETNSFERRFATIEDIDISEIRHTNIDHTVEKPVGLFGKAGVPTTPSFNRHKRAEFDKVETMPIDKFMSAVLPYATALEVFLEGRMENNLVTLFTTKDKNAKNLFKWDNPFSWTYKNNLSGKSMIKENVKAVGGKITGVLRCSLQWNDEDTPGIIDFDLHCKTPFTEVYYSNKKDIKSKLWLDVDMISPKTIGIENITTQTTLPAGIYKFYVINYWGQTQHKGFKAEIEFGGKTFNYRCSKIFTGIVDIATITVDILGKMEIEHHLPEETSARNIWGLDTNQFHKVNLVCNSPNHWGNNNSGTKEYFFMLQDCKSDQPLRAFHIDQLNSELMGIRKTLELLGNYSLIQPTNKQLAGLGFNSTVRDELIVKVSGTHKRILKITF